MTLLCEEKKHAKKLYLFLCTKEWLKVVWIIMFSTGISYLECDKRRDNSLY
jgi:hypothetical protein